MNNIEILENLIKHCHDKNDILYKLDEETKKALENILFILNNVEDYTKQIIYSINETFADYIDDGYDGYLKNHKNTNQEFINELKEQLIPFNDILRILKNQKPQLKLL